MSSPVTAQLILIQGDPTQFQATIDLENQNRSIGRAQNCDIVWGSLQISRKHATLEYMLPNWYIRDTSTNGLSVNGLKLVKGELFLLKDTDIISFIPTGTVRYRFRYITSPSPLRGIPPSRAQNRTISPQPSTSSAALASTSRSADNSNNNNNGRRSVELIGGSDDDSNHSESLLSLDPPDDYFSFSGDENGRSPSAGVDSDNASSGPNVSKRKHKVDSSSEDSDNNSMARKKILRVQYSPSPSSDDESIKSDSHNAGSSKCTTLRISKKSKTITDAQIDQCNNLEELKKHLKDSLVKLKTTECKLEAVKFDRNADREEFRKREHDVRSVNAAFKEETYKKILEVMESEFSCSVCNEVFIQATVIDCGHTFCNFCINEWARKKTECPICRKSFRNRSRHIEMENYIKTVFESFSAEIATKRKLSIKEREEQVKKAVEDARVAAAENQARGGNNFHAFIQSTAERYVDFLAELHQINEILGPRAGGGRGGPAATSAERRRSARIQDRVIDVVVSGAGGGAGPGTARGRAFRGRRNATANANNAPAAGVAAVPQIGMGRAAAATGRAVPAANINAAPVPVVTLNDTADDPNPSPPTVRFPQFMNYVRRGLPNLIGDGNRNEGSAN